MTYGDVLAIVFVHVGFMAAFQAYWLVGGALFPKMARSAERSLTERPIRTWLMGIATAFPVVLVFAATSKAAAPFKIVGVGLALLAAMTGMFGVAGLTRRIGAGLLGEAAADERPGLCAFRGCLVLSFTFIMPFLGWFIVIPTTLVAGLGAVAQYALIDRRREGGRESGHPAKLNDSSHEAGDAGSNRAPVYESVV